MITLYDIPSQLPSNAWTPNPYKARSALNFKKIPYKTEWVEYPDIEAVCKKIGAPPTEKRHALDGSGLKDHYTLPAIYDSATGKAISDSYTIAEYLEETYPDTPKLFPEGTRAAIALFNKAALEHFVGTVFTLVIPSVPKRLNPSSAEYFHQTREYWMKTKLEDLTPPGPKRDQAWEQVRKGLTLLAGFYEKNKNSNGEVPVFFIGNTLTYADIVMGSFLNWPKTILSEEDFNWDDIAKADGGLWGRIVDEVEKYREVL